MSFEFAIFSSELYFDEALYQLLSISYLTPLENLDVTTVSFVNNEDNVYNAFSPLKLFGMLLCIQFDCPYIVFFKPPEKITSDHNFHFMGKRYIGCFSFFPQRDDLLKRIRIEQRIQELSYITNAFTISGDEIKHLFPNAELSKSDIRQLDVICSKAAQPIYDWIEEKKLNLRNKLDFRPSLYERDFSY